MAKTKKKAGCREWFIRITMIVVSTVICLILVNLIFKKGSGEGSEEGINYSLLNDSINQRNYDFAQQNPYQFTDIVREKEKPDSVFRIAVLGDSFIWGDGMPYENVWSHKLERMVAAEYPNVEVLSWGRNGWSTLDELNFLKEHGKDYDIDLLIIGYVDNDPDMGDYHHMDPSWLNNPKWLYKVAPNLTYSIMFKIYMVSFRRWMDDLHTEKNLKKYGEFLSEFHTYTDSLDLPVLFVLTPNNKKSEDYDCFSKVTPYMDQAGFAYINLHPMVNSRFAEVDYDLLMANPVNHHPGDSLTKFFAEVTLDYLKEQELLLQTKDILNPIKDTIDISQLPLE